MHKLTMGFVLAGMLVSVFGWGAVRAEKRSEVDSSLIGFWHFDEGKGKIAQDSSGRDNDGKIHGASWVGEGISGSCLSFDGEDDYVDCGYDLSSMDFHAFTVEVWIKPNELGEAQGIVTRGWRNPWGLYIDETSRFRMGITLIDAHDHVISPLVLATGRWYHVAVTFNSTDGNIIFHINGEMDYRHSLPTQKTRFFDTRIHIGSIFYKDIPHSTGYFKGLIDEVRIYNRALSIEEIRKHYKSDKGA